MAGQDRARKEGWRRTEVEEKEEGKSVIVIVSHKRSAAWETGCCGGQEVRLRLTN
jgi:hypothetical protein